MHAYAPKDRMLLGPVQWKFLPTHVLFDYDKFAKIGGILAANFMSPYIGHRVEMCTCVVVALLFMLIAHTNVMRARRRNTTSRQPHVSKNMPMLFAHLRQLEAAGLIIQAHVSRSPARPATPAVASLSSSLALMHALKSQAQIKQFLNMRLNAAFVSSVGHRRAAAIFAHARNFDQRLFHMEIAMDFPFFEL